MFNRSILHGYQSFEKMALFANDQVASDFVEIFGMKSLALVVIPIVSAENDT